MTDHAVPNLPSRDFDATVAFYGGFAFVPSFREDKWLILRRGTIQLEFFPSPTLDPATNRFLCCVRVDDVDGLYRLIRDSGVPEKRAGFPRLQPVESQSWGKRAGFLIDPDGTQLTLIQNSPRIARP